MIEIIRLALTAPWAPSPWQAAHTLSYAFFPAAIDAGVLGTGLRTAAAARSAPKSAPVPDLTGAEPGASAFVVGGPVAMVAPTTLRIMPSGFVMTYNSP